MHAARSVACVFDQRLSSRMPPSCPLPPNRSAGVLPIARCPMRDFRFRSAHLLPTPSATLGPRSISGLSDRGAAVVGRRNGPPRMLSVAMLPDSKLCAPEQACLRRHPTPRPKNANGIGWRRAVEPPWRSGPQSCRSESALAADRAFRRRPPCGSLGPRWPRHAELATIPATRMPQRISRKNPSGTAGTPETPQAPGTGPGACGGVPPVGLEPTTCGLKVRSSTN